MAYLLFRTSCDFVVVSFSFTAAELQTIPDDNFITHYSHRLKKRHKKHRIDNKFSVLFVSIVPGIVVRHVELIFHQQWFYLNVFFFVSFVNALWAGDWLNVHVHVTVQKHCCCVTGNEIRTWFTMCYFSWCVKLSFIESWFVKPRQNPLHFFYTTPFCIRLPHYMEYWQLREREHDSSGTHFFLFVNLCTDVLHQTFEKHLQTKPSSVLLGMLKLQQGSLTRH